MSRKALTFGEEMNCGNHINSKGKNVNVESPADKSSNGGMQDTPTANPATGWSGMPPQSVPR
ncbi:hypothetical protein PRZ02_05650 [Thermoproteati archaeon 3817-70]